MSEIENVKSIVRKTGSGGIDFPNGLKISGSNFVPGATRYSQAEEPSNPTNGDTWWDTDDEKYKMYINDSWMVLYGDKDAITWGGDRALIYRGYNFTSNAYENDIVYYNITTPGNASAFGDSSAGHNKAGAAGNKTRNLLFYVREGSSSSSNSASDRIDYVTVSTTGNATDFGNQGYTDGSGLHAISNGIKAFSIRSFGSGEIEVVTIDTPGNATQWSENDAALNVNQGYNQSGWSFSGSFNDATRAVFRRSDGRMFYFNMDTYANVTEFGTGSSDNLHSDTYGNAGDGTYGIIAGGRQSSATLNNISYITIQSPGNATDFGDLTIARQGCATTGNGTYATISGGKNGSTGHNTIDYITIATPGNATDFGDLVTNAGEELAAGSGSP
jgi:hypothetical protein